MPPTQFEPTTALVTSVRLPSAWNIKTTDTVDHAEGCFAQFPYKSQECSKENQ
jgi:hypothetical protein